MRRVRAWAIVAAAACEGRAWAQGPESKESLQQAKDTGYTWLLMVVGVVLVLGVVFASFMSSRRTHQD